MSGLSCCPGVQLHCDVALGADAQSELPTGIVNRLIDHLHYRAERWAREVAGFLAMDPGGPIAVTLDPKATMPYTRGRHVVLPLDPRPGRDIDAMSYGLNALPHELVHAIAGRSPSHLLNEGLAVHVDAALRLVSRSWPHYGLLPHRWVRAFLDERTILSPTELLYWTPGPLVTRAQRVDCAALYLHAGSLAGYLFTTLGDERFWALYRLPVGASDSIPVDDLEPAWLASLGGPLTTVEHALIVQSRARWQ